MSKTKPVSLRMDEELLRLVERYAKEKNMNTSQAISHLCEIGVLLAVEVADRFVSDQPNLFVGEIVMALREKDPISLNTDAEHLAYRVRNLEQTVRLLMKKTGLLGPSGAEFRSED